MKDGRNMPQIWMTYEETGDAQRLYARRSQNAGHPSVARPPQEPRRRTRVKLDLALTAKFFASIREADFDLDGAIAALQSTHRQMGAAGPTGSRARCSLSAAPYIAGSPQERRPSISAVVSNLA